MSIKKNFIYNIMYQILIMILPLITIPYVSRILGVDNIGIYSYTYSIIYYFMLFGLLGINNYGNRTIAKVRDDKLELSKNFLSIYTIQVVMNVISIIIYICYCLFTDIQYKEIAIIQVIYLISNVLDINWFFFGLEKFKLTVTRSTIIKILSLILIFIFVKTENDLWIYTFILAICTCISQIFLFKFLKKEIVKCKIGFNEIKVHIKPCFILFIPLIAVSLYKVMDKIMLGNISTIDQVGFYEQAEKIVNIPMGIVTALGTVMLPRISNLVNKNEDEIVKNYIEKSVKIMMFLAFPICFGIFAVSNEFVPIFLGGKFLNSIPIVKYLSITIIFISFANIIRTQYLIPKEKDKIFISSVLIGAIVNLIINFILIPKYNAIGACIGTIVAEFVVMLYQIIKVKNDLPIKMYLKYTCKYAVKALIMFAIIYLYNFININSTYVLLLKIITGCIIYGFLNIKYITSLFKGE